MARNLTEQQLVVLRLFGAWGMVAEEGLESQLASRLLFRDDGLGPCVQILAAGGLLDGSVPGIVCITEEGKSTLRACIQDKRRHIAASLKGEVWASFEALDKEFKQVCSAWQTREDLGCSNNHDDPEYDFVVVERLVQVHERLKSLVGAVNGWEQELGDLIEELENALRKVTEGEFDYFTGVNVCSYHNLWFELHEDLLCTLGLERSE